MDLIGSVFLNVTTSMSCLHIHWVWWYTGILSFSSAFLLPSFQEQWMSTVKCAVTQRIWFGWLLLWGKSTNHSATVGCNRLNWKTCECSFKFCSVGKLHFQYWGHSHIHFSWETSDTVSYSVDQGFPTKTVRGPQTLPSAPFGVQFQTC